MSKTWYGHHIETIKGEDYVLHKDYTEIEDKLDKYKSILDKIKETINYYAIENEDYSKIYNQEEQEIIKLLEEIE